MNKIKIYEDEYGGRFVKMQINMIIDIPIGDEIADINNNECIDKLFEMERVDLGEMILNESHKFRFLLESDNIAHIEVEIPVFDKQEDIVAKEKEYLTFELFHDIVKSEMLKGNEFAVISSRKEFTLEDRKKIEEIGFNMYHENGKYFISWKN